MGFAGIFLQPNDAAVHRARCWLVLAVGAVAVSGLFAILIALARVPALGTLFPGAEFYRVALVLHVNLSQGVWFMAFAGVLWSLAADREPERLERLAWGLAVAGTIGIVLAVSGGDVRPLMSNYLPVLDNMIFLASLALFGLGVFLKSISALAGVLRQRVAGDDRLGKLLLLRLSAVGTIAVFMLLGGAWLGIDRERDWIFFETLFWGAGHLWQFALVSLLMFCWLELAPDAADRLPRPVLKGLALASAIPVLLAFAVPLFQAPGSAAYTTIYTWLMQWTSWEAPLLLGVALLLSGKRGTLAPGFVLSLLLFAVGLILGVLINGQTTLVTAHYHGTIGAITLAFMAVSFRLLPSLGIEAPSLAVVRTQLAFYGNGILLMMIGLAGAGLMGAPRKTPGDLQVAFSVETFSRICLGIGGLCATIGIVMFAYLLIRRLFAPTRMEAYSS